MVELFYDFPGGLNLNIIRSQQGLRGVLHDVEWNNKTSFYFDPGKGTCRTIHFPVGILRPDWLAGATYLGTTSVGNRTALAFTKLDFITYWEDAETGAPLRWRFHSDSGPGQFEVMTFEEGVRASPHDFQAPASCFAEPGIESSDPAARTIPGLI